MRKKKIRKIARTEERYLDIVNLLENKMYDEIFETYGQRIYCLVVPKSYKKKEINKMMREGKFEDIYRKYGEGTYNRFINKMQQEDVYYETGSKFKGRINRVKNVIKRKIAPILISLPIAFPITAIAGEEIIHIVNIIEGAKKYGREIEEYDRGLKEKAEEIQKMNLTDIQIFAKVMRDMWGEIDGYAEPEKTISGYERLSLKSENKGVCRHFADHTTAQLNAINPEYNARNVIVYLSNTNGYRPANIERKIIEDNETVHKENEQPSNGGNNFDFTRLTGNHMATAVDIPNKNISLIIDTTNLGIGVFKDGRIYMFFSKNGKGLEMVETFQVMEGGILSALDIDGRIIKSCFQTGKSLNELEEEWGQEAINKALIEVADIEEKMNAKDRSTFVAKVKVDEKMAIKSVGEKAEKTTKKDNEIAD